MMLGLFCSLWLCFLVGDCYTSRLLKLVVLSVAMSSWSLFLILFVSFESRFWNSLLELPNSTFCMSDSIPSSNFVNSRMGGGVLNNGYPNVSNFSGVLSGFR